MAENRLGDFVRARRNVLRLKQSDVAERMGPDVDTTYVTKVETGRVKVPQQPFLGQLARALGVSQVDLLREAGVITDELPGAEHGIAETAPPYDPTSPRALLLEKLPDLSDDAVDQMLWAAEWWERHVKERVVEDEAAAVAAAAGFYREPTNGPERW